MKSTKWILSKFIFSPDVSGSQDGSIRIWEWSHGQAVQNVRPAGVFSKVNRLRFTQQGNKFGVADGDGNVVLWQAGNAYQSFFVSYATLLHILVDIVRFCNYTWVVIKLTFFIPVMIIAIVLFHDVFLTMYVHDDSAKYLNNIIFCDILWTLLFMFWHDICFLLFKLKLTGNEEIKHVNLSMHL